MKKLIFCLLLATTAVFSRAQLPQCTPANLSKYKSICREFIYKDMKGMYREKGGSLAYPFLAPGTGYEDILWDWDSWLSDIALNQILTDHGTDADRREAVAYEQGCVLNFLNYCYKGWIPYWVTRDQKPKSEIASKMNIFKTNMHKPMLAQQAAFITMKQGGDAEWLREWFYPLQTFEDKYMNFHRNKATGLLFWENDRAIGVDTDPSTFFRPDESSGSIFLNAMMYKELSAMSYLAGRLGMDSIAKTYDKQAGELLDAIRENCWDPRDRFYYSVDLNLTPLPDVSDKSVMSGDFVYHVGGPRNYDCLIQRFSVWSGFMAMWAGIATEGQAKDMVEKHYRNKEEFNCAAGIYTLSPLEKMFNTRATNNPSSWSGPVWIIANYMTFRGLLRYGYTEDARELAQKTVLLLGRDFVRFGALHEYYLPDNGEPVLNKGFQNWNYLVLNMIDWLDGKKVITEFQ